MKLTAFTPSCASMIFEWFESGKYKYFFRALTNFYSPEVFTNLPQFMGHILLIHDEKGMVGMCNVYDWNHISRVCSVGIMIIEDRQGEGLAVHTLKMLGDLLFKDKAVQKINVTVRSDDPILEHLSTKFKVHKEGEFKRQMFVDGEFKDSVSYALFVEDWS